jgi:putative membrane protein
MKNLAKQFLTKTEQESIQAAVKEAEGLTSGEIVPLVVSASYHYPVADILGGATFALPTSIFLTPVVCGLFWTDPRNMWVLLCLFIIFFSLFYQIVQHIPVLKRLFISRHEINAEVEEAALTSFYKNKLYETRDRTAVLLFISVFERKVWILADRGIDEKLSQKPWQGIVVHVIQGIKKGQQCTAICEAVEQIGQILQTHFPVKPEDTDELKNLIIGE